MKIYTINENWISLQIIHILYKNACRRLEKNFFRVFFLITKDFTNNLINFTIPKLWNQHIQSKFNLRWIKMSVMILFYMKTCIYSEQRKFLSLSQLMVWKRFYFFTVLTFPTILFIKFHCIKIHSERNCFQHCEFLNFTRFLMP